VERNGWEIPLFASSVSYKLLPSFWRASAALRARLASSSVCAASHSSERSMGASIVPPDTNLEDIILSVDFEDVSS